MLNYFVRIAKRFVVLVPGLVIAYFSIHSIFPLIDKKTPAAIAIFLTYVLSAYVLIPAFIRLIRIVLPARHLQAYSVTPDGFASDPVNIGIIGTKRHLVKAMRAAGWHVADKHSLKNVVHEVVSAALNRSYETAPMSNLYLFGRKQDIGFERTYEVVAGTDTMYGSGLLLTGQELSLTLELLHGIGGASSQLADRRFGSEQHLKMLVLPLSDTTYK